LSRIGNAFSSFFGILFSGELPPDVAKAYGYVKASEVKKPEPVKPAAKIAEVKPADGALQLLGILQRDARLVDFPMENITPYAGGPVGPPLPMGTRPSPAGTPGTALIAPLVWGVIG